MAKFEISMISVAIPFAAHAFRGHMDKTGREPAIMHSLRVEKAVQKYNDEITQVIALLHDTVEDTTVTLDDIRKEFAAYGEEAVNEILEGVKSVTRGYINRSTGEMVFSPPEPGLVCDCKSTCTVFEHVFYKERYRSFVMRGKRHPRGKRVKIADIQDNMTPERVEGLSEAEKGIVEERYIPALAFLKDPTATEYFTPRQLARICKFCHKPFSVHEGHHRLCPEKDLFGNTVTFKGVR